MPSSVQQDSDVVCKICRRQISRYTCPECNLAYCSSTCFKSPVHANCSEMFSKKQIEADVRSNSSQSKTAEERLKMMELLRRFEEDHLDQNGLENEEDEDMDDFEKRFAGIDIASTSPNILWSLLSQTERDEFMKAIQDPSSNLAQELLLSDELQNELECVPWWEAEDRSRRLPGLINIPATMIKPVPSGSPLIYNICAICIAYAFVTRRLALSPLSSINSDSEDSEEARRLLAQLVPFLMNRKSTVLHVNISTAVDDVCSKLDVVTSISSSAFTVLMRDVATILRPRPIGDIDSHPNHTIVYVLSDLHRLFATHSHIAYKLLFYAAQVISTPPPVLRSLASGISARATAVSNQVSSEPIRMAKTPEVTSELNSSKTRLIEEISSGE